MRAAFAPTSPWPSRDLLRTSSTEPPAAGFGAFGWAMPFVAVALGLAMIPFVIQKWRRDQAALQAAGWTSWFSSWQLQRSKG